MCVQLHVHMGVLSCGGQDSDKCHHSSGAVHLIIEMGYHFLDQVGLELAEFCLPLPPRVLGF